MLLSKLVDLIESGDSKFIKANIIENIDIENAASLEIASKNQISFLEENNILRDKRGADSGVHTVGTQIDLIPNIFQIENTGFAVTEFNSKLVSEFSFYSGTGSFLVSSILLYLSLIHI